MEDWTKKWGFEAKGFKCLEWQLGSNKSNRVYIITKNITKNDDVSYISDYEGEVSKGVSTTIFNGIADIASISHVITVKYDFDDDWVRIYGGGNGYRIHKETWDKFIPMLLKKGGKGNE